MVCQTTVHFKNLNFSKLNPANNVILQPFAELKPPWINQIIPYICPTYKNKFFAILYNLLQFSRKIKSNPPKSPHFSLPLSHLHNFGEEKSKIFISLPASAAAPPALISIRGPPGRSPIPLWPPAHKAVGFPVPRPCVCLNDIVQFIPQTAAMRRQSRHSDTRTSVQGGGSPKPIYDFLTIGEIIVKYEIILYPACAVIQQTTEPVCK